MQILCFFFFSSRRRHTRFDCDWSSDVCSSDLVVSRAGRRVPHARLRRRRPRRNVEARSRRAWSGGCAARAVFLFVERPRARRQPPARARYSGRALGHGCTSAGGRGRAAGAGHNPRSTAQAGGRSSHARHEGGRGHPAMRLTRAARAGQSEYLLNRSAVRLRDIQDLLRGTGLGADAAVVMEARMIEALLSEKAEERRALFEEAAGIGLYRDRRTSTERRLEETAADLARLEDLVSEVQTQVRSLARQRGKAERYDKMIDERFGIALTLVRRELEDFDLTLGGLGQRAEQLAAALPGGRTRLEATEGEREAGVQGRHTAEARRTEVERRLADAKLETGRLEGDLALAADRLRNAGQRRVTAGQRRKQEESRAVQAERERVAAAAECQAAERDLASVGQELAGRTALEQEGRDRLLAQRAAVRELEEDLQRRAEGSRALEGERAALERERAELGQQLADASQERARRAETEWAATAQVGTRAEQATALARAAAQAAAGLEQARRRVAELKEQETHGRAARRQAEGALAQVTARHDALAELERERVGLAPAAQALLKAREQFGDAVIGPLSDFVRTTRRDAVLAEQLLGEWLHAVLVRDAAAVDAIRRWHEQAQPGPLVLLPSVPGPRLAADGHPLKDDLRVDGPAATWVRALLAGHEVLEGGENGGPS